MSHGMPDYLYVHIHALFNLGDKQLDSTIYLAAIEAAIHFVEVCCQQVAYIAGRGDLDEELKLFVQDTFV